MTSLSSSRVVTVGAALGDFGGVGPGFDSLRLGAAIAVLVSHAFDIVGQSSSEPFRLFALTNISLGGTATYVFFLISGFLVTASLLRTQSVGEFALKRAARILPGLVGVVLVAAFIIGPAFTTKPMAAYFSDPLFGSYFWNAALVYRPTLPGVFNNADINGSIWTLLYEAVCYGLLVLVGIAGWLRPRRALLAVVAVLIVLGWWAKGRHWYTVEPIGLMVPYILRFAAYFTAGVAFYLFRDRIPLDKRLAIGALLLSIVFLHFGPFHIFFPVLGGYLVVYLGMQPAMALPALRGNDYSYGFYVYAFPMQQIALHALPVGAFWWGNIALSMPLTILCAICSWHLIEKPALSWARGPVGMLHAVPGRARIQG